MRLGNAKSIRGCTFECIGVVILLFVYGSLHSVLKQSAITKPRCATVTRNLAVVNDVHSVQRNPNWLAHASSCNSVRSSSKASSASLRSPTFHRIIHQKYVQFTNLNLSSYAQSVHTRQNTRFFAHQEWTLSSAFQSFQDKSSQGQEFHPPSLSGFQLAHQLTTHPKRSAQNSLAHLSIEPVSHGV